MKHRHALQYVSTSTLQTTARLFERLGICRELRVDIEFELIVRALTDIAENRAL